MPRFKPRKIEVTLMARPNLSVPPQHWSYKKLEELVKRGHIVGYPIFFFQGAKTYSRGEIADILKKVLQRIRREGDVPGPDDLYTIRQLVAEFEPELKKKKVKTDLGYTQIQKLRNKKLKKRLSKTGRRFTYNGSSTTGYVRELEAKTSAFNENLVFNASRDSAHFHISLSANEEDLSQVTPGVHEFALGDKFLASVDKYSLELDHKVRNGRYDLISILGYTGGSSFSQGLTIGNLNLEGANFSLQDKKGQYDLVFGRTQGATPDQLIALHGQRKVKKNLLIHLQSVGALYHPESSTGSTGRSDDILLGIGAETSLRDIALLFEANSQKGGGYGSYLQASYQLGSRTELLGEIRHYENLNFDYNSPNVYAGVSGGDDNLDRGFSLEVNYNIRDDLIYTIQGDSSFNGSLGDLVYVYQEFAYDPEWISFSASYEREWTDNNFNHITSLRCSKKWTDTFKTSIDWSRDLIDGSGSDNARFSTSYDIIKDIVSVTANLTNKHSDSGRSLSQQFGLNWNKSAIHFLSMQLSLTTPDASRNSAEVNFLMKF